MNDSPSNTINVIYEKKIEDLKEYIEHLENRLSFWGGYPCAIINDEWCTNPLFEINNKNIKRNGQMEGQIGTIKGQTIIASNYHNCYSWNIKILNCCNTPSSKEFCIGIIPDDDNYECCYYSTGKIMQKSGMNNMRSMNGTGSMNNNFGMNSMSSTMNSFDPFNANNYGSLKSLKSGDTLTIIMDMNKLSVSFLINMIHIININLNAIKKTISTTCSKCYGYGNDPPADHTSPCFQCNGKGKQIKVITKTYCLGITCCSDEDEFELIDFNEIVIVGYLRNNTNYVNGRKDTIKVIRNYLGNVVNILFKTIPLYRFGIGFYGH